MRLAGHPDMKNPAHLPVARGTAKYVGDAVAVVLADSRYAAADGAAAVVVDYEPLPAVVEIEDAVADGAPLVHADLESNECYTWGLWGDNAPAIDAAFAEAAHVVSERYLQQRLIPAPMEPRGCAAVPSPAGGELTLYSATQIPHILKVMTAVVLGIPENKLRVVAPSVGGGFGCKLNVYAEEILCSALATQRGAPVRWTEGRAEAAVSTIQGRGQVQHIELAADADGKVTAVRVKLLADMGAYLQLVTPGVPLLGGFLYHGCYDIPNYMFECTSVFTNRTPTDAYRGAGRPEATYAVERAMDSLAVSVGVSPEEIRARNFIGADAFPYESAAGLIFDSGDYQTVLDKAVALADVDGRRAEQAQRRASGSSKRIGVGFSSYVEMCGLAPSRVLASLDYGAGGWEAATVRISPTCKVQVVTGSTPHGQGHETCWSMIVADQLGVDPDDVEVLHSDTAVSPTGLDTYGSRSLAVGGTAVYMATEKVIDKARAIAAHQLEASEEDLEFSGGTFSVRGTPEAEVPLAGIAFAAFTAHDLPDGMEPNLEAHVTYDPPNFTFPNGTHIAGVEVDTDTGNVDLIDYVAVDDCGVQINPLVVEGQVHGGILQGAAQALYEDAVYNSDGQLVSANLGRLPGAVGRGSAPLPARQPRHTQPHQSDGGEGRGRGRHHRGCPRGDQRRGGRPARPGCDRRGNAGVAPDRLESHRRCPRRCVVIPAAFDYEVAESADHAISLLGEHGDDAKLLAGGHSLIPMMRYRLATPSVLVDVGRLDDLRYIRTGNGTVSIGALTRHSELEHSAALAEACPMLASVAALGG